MSRTDAEWFGDTEADPSVDLAPSELFDILSGDRRREVLLALAEAQAASISPQVELGEIVDRITALECPSPPDADGADRKRVYVSLYQTHLPKLEDRGLISVDEDDEHTQDYVIRPGTDLQPIAELIRSVEVACEFDDRERGVGPSAPNRGPQPRGGGAE